MQEAEGLAPEVPHPAGTRAWARPWEDPGDPGPWVQAGPGVLASLEVLEALETGGHLTDFQEAPEAMAGHLVGTRAGRERRSSVGLEGLEDLEDPEDLEGRRGQQVRGLVPTARRPRRPAQSRNKMTSALT